MRRHNPSSFFAFFLLFSLAVPSAKGDWLCIFRILTPKAPTKGDFAGQLLDFIEHNVPRKTTSRIAFVRALLGESNSSAEWSITVSINNNNIEFAANVHQVLVRHYSNFSQLSKRLEKLTRAALEELESEIEWDSMDVDIYPSGEPHGVLLGIITRVQQLSVDAKIEGALYPDLLGFLCRYMGHDLIRRRWILDRAFRAHHEWEDKLPMHSSPREFSSALIEQMEEDRGALLALLYTFSRPRSTQ